MGDLKIENLRLQKFADILDSQPELTFCIDKSGQITFMSDSALNFMKSSNAEDNDDDPTHISQILTGESVGTVLDCVAQIRADQSASNNPHGDHDGTGFISSVQVILKNSAIIRLLKKCYSFRLFYSCLFRVFVTTMQVDFK